MSRRFALVVGLMFVVGGTVLAQQPQLPPRDLPRNQTVAGTGVISGIVRAADTGAPLRGVDIRLTGTGLRGGGLGGSRGAFTDADGRYEFLGLPEGQYTLVASKVPYMTMTYGQTRLGEEGRSVQVANGQRVEKVDFALPAGAVIVLRVGDRFGDPAVGYTVNLYQAKAGPGQRSLAQMSGSGFGDRTNDHGEIRLSGLPPGEYYVSAATGPAPPIGGVPREQEVQTFYPGTPVEADAQPITVGIGAEVVAEFNTVVSRLSRISGTVTGTARADLQLERVTPAGSRIVDILISVAPDGSFSRANLAPGEYILTARNAKEFGTLTVELGAEDIVGLTLPMKPVMPITGRITFEGTPPTGIAPTAFSLRPVLMDGGISLIAQHKPDWMFEIPTARGRGVLRADLPDGWFLKAVRLDGRDVTDTELDFQTYQGKPIEVVLTQRATEIRGSVTDSAGRGVPNYVAVAFAEDAQRWTRLTRQIVIARPDQQGRFGIRGLPPGRYLVAAVDYLQSGQERDARTLERLRARATAVTLAEDAPQNVTVTVTP